MGRRRRHRRTRSSSSSSTDSSSDSLSSASDTRYTRTRSERSPTPRRDKRVTASDGARVEGRQLRTSPLEENTMQGTSRCLISNKGTGGASTNSNHSGMHNTYEASIRQLESVIERMGRQNPSVETHRLAVRSDCIPKFCPENENMSVVKWLEKIEELKQLNDWDTLTTYTTCSFDFQAWQGSGTTV
nr:unnamed protein product [Callosobruchus analis]